MIDRVLIWGTGAIGAPVGAALVRHGVDVTFVDTAAAHVAAMRDPACGLVIEQAGVPAALPVRALVPAELVGRWDAILLCVKAHHTTEACRMLAPHLDDDGFVLSLQNGLVARVIAEQLGAQRTLAGFVNFGADVVGPGRIAFGNRGMVAIGEIDGAVTPRARAVHRLLQVFEPDAIVTSDIWSYLWGKLAYASLLFAQAAGDRGIADCLDDATLLPLWRRLAAETLAVAAAEGVRPRGFNGFDPIAFGPAAPPDALRSSVAAIAAFNRTSSKTHSGVWRDLAVHRRPTEVDAQLGMVVEIGARHGLASPTLAALVAMIHQIERGERSQSDANLAELGAIHADCL